MKTKKESEKKSERKTKILAVGDIHGDSGLVKRLAKKAEQENVDLVIFAGDITLGNREMKNIIAPFQKINMPVLLIPGNHEGGDTTDFLSQVYDNATNIHGYAFKKNDLGIFGAGTVDWGREGKNSDEILKLLRRGHKYIKDQDKKIMVTHMHHQGSKAEIFGFKGSKAVRKAIEEFHPDVLISAHIHEAGGLQEKIKNTFVINVSRNPTIFEI